MPTKSTKGTKLKILAIYDLMGCTNMTFPHRLVGVFSCFSCLSWTNPINRQASDFGGDKVSGWIGFYDFIMPTFF